MPQSTPLSEYAQIAEGYDRRWRRYLERTHQAVMACSPEALPVGAMCLDAGCGTGELIRSLKGGFPLVNWVGIDATRAMLSVARSKRIPHSDFVEADMAALPFASASFDLIVSSSALHFARDWRKAVAEWGRVLRPGGRLVVCDWWGEPWSMHLMRVWLWLTCRGGNPPIPVDDLWNELHRTGFQVDATIPTQVGGAWWVMTMAATKCSVV